MNYFSLWIGNFGVVPWFSFLFFLFLPIFLSFRALLVFVTCVLEAMVFSFAKLSYSETSFLTFRRRIVKVFLFVLTATPLFAQAKTLESDEFFLAKGEQIELEMKNLGSFSVGNKEVLKSKYYAAKNKLLVKGESLGFSDLVVWDQKGRKKSFHFYVVSKKEQLTTFQLANDFKSLGLEVKALAFELLVKGELNTLEELSLFNLYMQKNRDKVINMATLGKKLKNKIISEIYLKLADESSVLICSPVKTEIQCLYEGLDPESPKVKKVSQDYLAKFIPRTSHHSTSNYKIELKVFKTDESELNDMGLGLDKLGARVGELLNDNSRALVEDNQFLFSKKDLVSRVVSSPAIMASLDSPSALQLGAEIPVVSANQYGQQTNWKFAGLKLKTKLSLFETKLKLLLENELTHPVDNLIRGNKSSSEFFPKDGRYMEAFRVKYQLRSFGKRAIPGLSDIPLLKALFTSSSEQSTTQWLIGYVKITRLK